jgi:hypothetical protein
MTMKRRSALLVAPIATALLVGGTTDEPVNVEAASFGRAGYDTPAVHRQYGTPLKLNSHGHEPEGVYNLPHFDFHFYTTSEEEVAGIVPTDPDFASDANDVPVGDFVPQFYSVLAGPGDPPSAVAVPQMGVHWIDVRSPELQGVFGNPGGFQTFTRTFIYGSWDGRLTFLEPMITRAYLLTHPEEIVPIPQPARYPQAGWYPSAYSISFDAQAREYRIALVDLSWHD